MATVTLRNLGGSVVMTVPRKKDFALTAEDRDWLDAKPVGKEVL